MCMGRWLRNWLVEGWAGAESNVGRALEPVILPQAPLPLLGVLA
jgi:hypothetical protein